MHSWASLRELHGALVLPGEEVRASNVCWCWWRNVGYMLILGSLYKLCSVSLITGLGYGVEK